MDPFVIVILTLVALGGGGAGGAAALWRRHQRRVQMQRAVSDKVDHDGRSLSIFDVFWDLGVSEYALALMDSQKLLLDAPADFERVHQRLDELIDAHGTYTDLIEDNLAAIQEFYREHRRAGARRQLPTMTLRHKKLLPVEDSSNASTDVEEVPMERPRSEDAPGDEEAGAAEHVESEIKEDDLGNEPGDLEGEIQEDIEQDLGRVVRDSVEERRVYREERSPMAMTVAAGPDDEAGDEGVDVDELVDLEPLQMLQSLFEGRFTERIQKWWKFRRLRAEKSRLDDDFEALYDYYAELAERRSDYYTMLYDMADRWRKEAGRIEELADDAPWRDEPFADCAEALVDRAQTVASQLALSAKLDVDRTVDRIHRFARRGDKAMAGYLLYLNHHAFFAGRAPDYGDYVQRIERRAYRVRRELRKLRRDGEI
ncbi:MAG: hypothetical protein ACOCV2_06545 [Persicimonas sp.]